MFDKESNIIIKLFKFIIIIIGIYYIVSFIFIVWHRIDYPFELEWMEGGSLIQIKRISAGLKFYTAPSIDFIPAIYTPLYYYVSLISCYIFGFHFFSIRLVSFISSILILIVLYFICLCLLKNKFYSFICVSFFIASFKAAGAWLDIGRVDSLAYFFLVTGMFFLIKSNSIPSMILSPIFFLLSYFTKQSNLIFVLFVFIYLYFENRKIFLPYFLFFIILTLSVHLYFNSINEGWFSYYTLVLSNSLETKYNKLLTFWLNDLIKNFPIAILSFIIFFNISKGSSKLFNRNYFILLLGFIVISYLPRIKIGGYDNALIPAFIGISIFSSISFKFLEDILTNNYKKLIYVSIIVQLAILYYPIKPQIPSIRDLETGKNLIEKIKSFKDDIFFPDHPYYLLLANKNPQAQTMAVSDFLYSNTQLPIKKKMLNDLSNKIKNKKYDALIFDRKDFLLKIMENEIKQSYILIDDNLSGDYFIPVVGGPNKPTYLFVKKLQ